MKIEDVLVQLVSAGLKGDRQRVRTLSLTASRFYKATSPDISAKISKEISESDVGANLFRSAGMEPHPTDSDTRMDLLRVEQTLDAEPPVFSEPVQKRVREFLFQRANSEKLIAHGMSAPKSVLLFGEPGVGKTMLGRYLAQQSQKPLLVLDLAASVSSFLGKTGQNLKKVFDYAKHHDAVLFLDEFDAIAKKRDDATDLGELKRIVNILLKELEDWPDNSILIAATNHPELLDRAIWRRFDEVVEIPLPDSAERIAIVRRHIRSKLDQPMIELLVSFTKDINASELVRICNKIERRVLLETELSMPIVMAQELVGVSSKISKKDRAELCKLTHKFAPGFTYEQIAELVNLSTSTVFYHINKGKSHEPRVNG